VSIGPQNCVGSSAEVADSGARLGQAVVSVVVPKNRKKKKCMFTASGQFASQPDSA